MHPTLSYRLLILPPPELGSDVTERRIRRKLPQRALEERGGHRWRHDKQCRQKETDAALLQ
ncbi:MULTISPECIES: hypothetical protein [Rhodanobacteraceae]|uniref:hypothetical protein n=1 Tax=Rhodanobacteraceae TaxID=1775411 RepID=UPI000881BEF4|nr:MULTISPECIES: hypothetical protein [Rhodanobacteraceae]SDH07793.1 hypothetical protein SAMN04515659_0042 [Dyella sp. 333MFSha]SKC07909.1 hypothetical protein SAMN05660880_04102 [Luteibacter sp. 22Crub2.1]